MEHSDRGRWVTFQVQLWIENDGANIVKARELAKQGTQNMAVHLTGLLVTSNPYSAPWQVAQELAPNDYDRIDWESIAVELREGGE